MKKNKFLQSTCILLIGGCITKIIGFYTRILYTRILKDEGISLLSLITPTYSLLMSLANFNIVVSISKQIAAEHTSKKTLINASYILLFLNIILITLTFLLAPFISHNLLKNPATYYPLLACSLTLPFISLGYIIKGYFYGKQNVTPHMISNILEQLFRLFLITSILPLFKKYSLTLNISIFILLNILSESFSILILLLFLPKNIQITKKDLKWNKKETNTLINLSLPPVSSRLLGNLGYFLEPIILTNILLYKGKSLSYITHEYGIYNGYIIPLLLFPSFFIGAICNSLLPEISKYNESHNTLMIKKRIKESLTLSFLVGLTCTTFIYLFKTPLLKIIYNTNEGLSYLKILSPFFILFYLEAPLSSILIGLNKIKQSSSITISSIILKLITLTTLSLKIGTIYALIYSEIIDILYITILESILLKKTLNNYNR